MNTSVFLLLGSNQGNNLENLARARASIAALPARILNASAVYQTAAWGKSDQEDFYNQVVEISLELKPHILLREIKKIETSLGRITTEKWGSRIIDIDILLYGQEIVDLPDLCIPHPGIPIRKFTLIPLNEIAPEIHHPVLQKNIGTLLAECSDQLEVRPID